MAKPVIRVFISYAQDYPSWAIEGITKILKRIKYNRGELPYQLYYWWDKGDPKEGGLVLGEDFEIQIKNFLNNADIILPLVTNSFFDSDFIRDDERPFIEERCKKYNSGVIPIIIGHTSYHLEWLGQYKLPTLPDGPEKPLSDSDRHRRRAEKWTVIDTKLSEKFIGLAANKQLAEERKREREKVSIKEKVQAEKPGCSVYLVFVFCLFLIGFGYYQTATAKGATEIRRGPEPSIDISDITISDAPPRTEDPDIPDDPVQVRPTSPSPPTGEKIPKREPIPSDYDDMGSARTLPDRQITNTSPSQRINNRGNDYGIYESCQGWDENGFRPCKRDRRWYIVNEDRNIHHMIDFPVRTHKDIYAIRPFVNGVAQVFYYKRPQGEMYRSFCVSLSDDIIDCSEHNP